LWNNVAVTMALESLMYAAGVVLYARATSPRDRIGTYGFWIFAALLAAIYIANIVGPPPGSATAVAVGALFLWPVVLSAGWIDRHRTSLHREPNDG
jgi:uncharacterized membrane protein YdjX (TVP38/TMEM64 family)